MALIKPEQLQSGSYNITGSFSGSFYGDGSNLNNLPVPSIDTGSLVTTSSFNSFTSSYYADSGSFSTRVTDLEDFSSSLDATFATEAELNAATSSLSASIANLSSSFETFSGSYNTGSFTGSFIGDLTGTASYAQTASYISASNIDGTVTSASYALTASYLDNYIPPFPYTGSAEITGSLSVTGSTSLFNSGSTILSVNGAQGEIFNITDDTSGDLLIVQSGSTDLFVVSASGDTTISGSLTINGPQGEIFSITDDLTGDLFTIQSGSVDLFVVSASGDTTISGSLIATNGITSSLYGTSSWAENSLTASYVENAQTASYIENAQTASYVLQAVSASHALTASYVNTLNQDVLITGSLTVLQGATIYGSSSFTYLTASQLAVSASFISVNVFEPVQRFGGLIVYDSGSSLATASIAWDSLHNHWVYQNASGSTYTGGMFLSGPRNTGSLGNEPTLTQWFVPRSDGTDHLENSQIFSSGSIHQVTGSLTVTGGVTGSFSGSVTAPGSSSQVIFNNANVLSADAGFTYSGSKLSLGQLNVNGEVILNRASTGQTVGGIRAIPGGTEIGGSTYLDRIILGNGSGLQFFTFTSGAGNAERMRITSGTSGVGVGIGTTTVSASLHVSGADSAALLKIDSPSNPNILFVTGSGRVGIGTSTPVDVVEIVGYSKYIKIAGTSETDRSAWIGNDAVGTGNVFLYNGTNSNTVFITGNGSSFLNGGNVGIGVFQSSISASLHISGTNSSNLFRIDSPSTPNILFVTGSGRVGIGTSTPANQLHVVGSTQINGNIYYGNTSTQRYLYTDSTSGYITLAAAGSNGYLNFMTGGYNTRMTIFSTGNIGIGTIIDESYKLDVSGSTRIQASAIITGSLTNQPVTLTATSGTASINCTQGNFFDLTLSSSSTIHLSSSNIQPGQTINLRITQPATSGSLTYGSQFKFAGGIPYSASATGSVVDIVSFISFDSTTLYGSAIKNLS